MRRKAWWLVGVVLVVGGCPEKTEPTGSPTAPSSASSAPTRGGSWAVTIRARTPDDDGEPAEVSLRDGAIAVEGTDRPSDEELDTIADVITSTDWQKMKLRLSLEGAVPGGTITTITVKHDGETYELATADPSKYPALQKLVKAVGTP